MFKQLATQLTQHLLSQNTWAFSALQPFGGQSVKFRISAIDTSLVILENGNLAIGGNTASPDAIVTISANVALRLIMRDATAKSQIDINGDTHLVAELTRVLQNISWDYEEDLSKFTGDAVAHKLGEWSRETIAGVKKQSLNVAEMVSEYWQEEMPMIAKKRHVEAFVNEVDILRADVERTEKRLDKLLGQIKN
ncbi:MAG: hypothetical protein H7Z18_11695 [Methylophilaceae bacterium]|nr:hypothetical protein [Methylophilaceae bacterium]